MASFSALGIVLRRIEYGEASQLFHFYTREHGKVEAVSRGAKKPLSKLRGHLEPFGVVQILVAGGRRLDQLAGAQLEQSFSAIPLDLKKIALASFGLELVDALTRPGVADARIFELLVRYLRAVDETPTHHLQAQTFQDHFALQLFDFLGLRPTPEVRRSSRRLHTFLVSQLEAEPVAAQFLASLSHS